MLNVLSFILFSIQDKLKLCVEQELVRAFTNFEREVIGKSVPYSACFVLRVQEEGNNWEVCLP